MAEETTMNRCAFPCDWKANYWWYDAVGNKRIGMCFGHALFNAVTKGGWKERK